MADELSDFDSAHFRAVLGHFPTGVTIVSGLADGQPIGFTVGSFMSISLDPPLVGFLAMHDSETWMAMAPTSVSASTSSATPRRRCAGASPGGQRGHPLRWVGLQPASVTGPGHRRCPRLDRLRHRAHHRARRPSAGRRRRAGPRSPHRSPRPLVFYKGALGGFAAEREHSNRFSAQRFGRLRRCATVLAAARFEAGNERATAINLYVGNLPFSTTSHDLSNLFARLAW